MNDAQATLYSFRRCPYAMRARLALLYAGVRPRMVEVSLKAKPPEMLALSPKGTVPVLSVGERVIDESLQIMLWALEQNDPGDWRLLGEPQARVQMAGLIEENDQVFKVHLNRYKYAERYPEAPMEHYRAQGELFLARLERLLSQQRYLLGGHQAWRTRPCCPSSASSPTWIATGSPRRPTRRCKPGCRAGWSPSCSARSWPSPPDTKLRLPGRTPRVLRGCRQAKSAKLPC